MSTNLFWRWSTIARFLADSVSGWTKRLYRLQLHILMGCRSCTLSRYQLVAFPLNCYYLLMECRIRCDDNSSGCWISNGLVRGVHVGIETINNMKSALYRDGNHEVVDATRAVNNVHVITTHDLVLDFSLAVPVRSNDKWEQMDGNHGRLRTCRLLCSNSTSIGRFRVRQPPDGRGPIRRCSTIQEPNITV